jgi:pSer/pThr/pTyr-binding forkhead associated (FHA) protein
MGDSDMATTLRLSVITGPHRGERFCFRGPACCTIGRAPSCFVQLSGEERDSAISRYHCQLKVHVPFMRVEDLGSANGTYVNGHEVRANSLPLSESPGLCEADGSAFLGNGDILTIGGTSFRLDVVDCPPLDKANVDVNPVWMPGEVAKKACPVSC